MTTLILIIDILFVIAAVALLLTEVKWDMQMMQQNSYRNERFIKWLKGSSEYAGVSRLADLAMLVLALSTFMQSWPVKLILAIASALLRLGRNIRSRSFSPSAFFVSISPSALCSSLWLPSRL